MASSNNNTPNDQQPTSLTMAPTLSPSQTTNPSITNSPHPLAQHFISRLQTVITHCRSMYLFVYEVTLYEIVIITIRQCMATVDVALSSTEANEEAAIGIMQIGQAEKEKVRELLTKYGAKDGQAKKNIPVEVTGATKIATLWSVLECIRAVDVTGQIVHCIGLPHLWSKFRAHRSFLKITYEDIAVFHYFIRAHFDTFLGTHILFEKDPEAALVYILPTHSSFTSESLDTAVDTVDKVISKIVFDWLRNDGISSSPKTCPHDTKPGDDTSQRVTFVPMECDQCTKQNDLSGISLIRAQQEQLGRIYLNDYMHRWYEKQCEMSSLKPVPSIPGFNSANSVSGGCPSEAPQQDDVKPVMSIGRVEPEKETSKDSLRELSMAPSNLPKIATKESLPTEPSHSPVVPASSAPVLKPVTPSKTTINDKPKSIPSQFAAPNKLSNSTISKVKKRIKSPKSKRTQFTLEQKRTILERRREQANKMRQFIAADTGIMQINLSQKDSSQLAAALDKDPTNHEQAMPVVETLLPKATHGKTAKKPGTNASNKVTPKTAANPNDTKTSSKPKSSAQKACSPKSHQVAPKPKAITKPPIPQVVAMSKDQKANGKEQQPPMKQNQPAQSTAKSQQPKQNPPPGPAELSIDHSVTTTGSFTEITQPVKQEERPVKSNAGMDDVFGSGYGHVSFPSEKSVSEKLEGKATNGETIQQGTVADISNFLMVKESIKCDDNKSIKTTMIIKPKQQSKPKSSASKLSKATEPKTKPASK